MEPVLAIGALITVMTVTAVARLRARTRYQREIKNLRKRAHNELEQTSKEFRGQVKKGMQRYRK